MNCINTNNIEFQTKLKQSGLSEFDYTVEVMSYFNKQRKLGVSEKNLKYPELDMMPDANSENFLSEQIKLKNNGTKIQNILNYTNTNDIKQANIEINNKHRDLEVNIIPLNTEALVQIEHRPTTIINKANEPVSIYKDKQALVSIFNKLSTLYGINFHNVTVDDIQSDSKFKDIIDAKNVNAFILDGDIYINMDVADIDAPIHEMGHLLLGSIKYQNPELYTELINISEKLPTYEELIKNYPSRTRSDINEEIFVTELSKFISNKYSIIQELPKMAQHDILYNVKRMLDSMLMGDISVKTIPTEQLLNMSIVDMAELVNSDVFNNISKLTLNDNQQHRILNNRKSDLIKNNELIERCQ